MNTYINKYIHETNKQTNKHINKTHNKVHKQHKGYDCLSVSLFIICQGCSTDKVCTAFVALSRPVHNCMDKIFVTH